MIQHLYSIHTAFIQHPYSIHTVSIQYPYSIHTVSIQYPYSSPLYAWVNASDKNIKDDVTLLDGKDILFKITQLPIHKWRYKSTNEYHIGPMAQDFYALFMVGGNDKTISTIDPAAIALLGVQEHQKMLDIKNKEMDILRDELVVLKAEIRAIKKLMTER